MTFVFEQSRTFLHDVAKPDGTFRVMCLGDSMTFGQGCPPLQTLPAQLETMLNADTWDQSVEVVNGGVSGFSIHDAWHHYVKQLKLFNPDLIVIIICYNDAELYPIYESQIESQRDMTYF